MKQDSAFAELLLCVAAVLGPIMGAILGYVNVASKRLVFICILAVLVSAGACVLFGSELLRTNGFGGNAIETFEAIATTSCIFTIGLACAWVTIISVRFVFVASRTRGNSETE